MRGFHPASGVPRRRRVRRRRAQKRAIFSTGSADFSRAPAHALSPTEEPMRALNICSLSTHDAPCLLPQRSPWRALHICSLSTHDDPCLLRLTRPYGLSTAAHFHVPAHAPHLLKCCALWAPLSKELRLRRPAYAVWEAFALGYSAPTLAAHFACATRDGMEPGWAVLGGGPDAPA